MKVSFFSMLLFMLSQVGFAQQDYQVTGRVMDASSKQPLEFATVSIYTLPDSMLVTGGLTETNGQYSIEVPSGRYYILSEYIGYAPKQTDGFQLNTDTTLPDIIMTAGGIDLETVEIRAERSELQFSLDKRVFNVGKDLSSKGGNAQDLLSNIPSISVGVEGEVELRGSSNVRILINGRPSGLVGLGDANGLRSIPSHLIERVEVVTNPSAKYEAEGMAGIINIIMKKEKAGGFNGAFEVTGGYPTRYGVGANVNYRKDRFNFFLNYNYNYHNSPSIGNNYQEFYRDATKVSLQKSLRDRKGFSNSVQFGTDVYLTDSKILTGAFLYRYSLDNNDNFITYRDTSLTERPAARLSNDDFSQYRKRDEVEREEEPTLEYSLHYEDKLGKGHKLDADISFQRNTEGESSDFVENQYLSSGQLLQSGLLFDRSRNTEGQQQWRFQVDYTRPFADNIKTEFGALGTFRDITNDYIVENKLDDVWTKNTNFSNEFIYAENVLAAYANVGQEWKRFSYQVGLRTEYSDILTELVNTSEKNPRTYYNLFPSAFMSYNLKNNNRMQLSYSRRIRRPGFWHLNPFFTFTDPRNYFGGNPNLNPEYTDSYEIGYLKNWESGNLGVTTYYRHTTDVFKRIQSTDVETQITSRIPQNVGVEDNIGLEVIYAYTGLKWLRLDGSINGFLFDIDGIDDISGESLTARSLAMNGRANAKLTFWKNTDVQLRLNYRGPRQSVQGRRKSMTHLNIALAKDFLNDNLSVILSVNDVFNNRKFNFIIDEDYLYQERDFQWRPRTFTVSINYRINMKKSRKRPRMMDGGGEM